MSTYYTFYAEVKIDGKWVGLSPYVKTHDGKFKIKPLIWGYSALHDTYLEMIDEHSARCGLPEDVSKELLEVFHALDEKTMDFWGKKEITWREYYTHCVHSVDYIEAVVNRIKRDRPYKFQGYVDKYLIASFEVGELEDLRSWLTKEEYEKLPDKEKKDYVWYEWNNYWDEYGYRFDLYQKVENLLDWYRDEAMCHDSKYKHEDVVGSNVRIIIHQS